MKSPPPLYQFLEAQRKVERIRDLVHSTKVTLETMELRAALEGIRYKEQHILTLNEKLLRAAHALNVSDEAGAYASHAVHYEQREQQRGEFELLIDRPNRPCTRPCAHISYPCE